MQREQFLTQLETLANEAGESNDKVVRQSAVVLLGLLGSISIGGGFFDSFVKNVAVVIKNQRDTIIDMKNNGIRSLN